MTKLLFLSLLFAAMLSFAQSGPTLRECAGSLTPVELDRQIDGLIAQMTPEERIAQLQDRAPAIARLGIPAYNWWNEGLHGIARNGYATVFPQAIGLAATFDPALLQQVGEVVGTEARAKFNPHQNADSPRYAGLSIWSPNINIFRDPRWGRGQETYGEDPYLTSLLAGGFIRGIQGPEGFYRRADATPKHFVAHSGPESLRDGFNAQVSAQDLADTYLPAFRIVTSDAHAEAMMCSYNAINGTPACANTALIEQRVRRQWGFAGYVVSDCDAVDEITEFLHYTADDAHGAAAALKAGVDLDCGSTYQHLNESLQQNLITLHDVDQALHRLLLARLRLGMLQPVSCSPYATIAADAVDTPANRGLALRTAEESMVLLENYGLLPYDFAGKRVAVIGPTGDLLEVIEANYHGTAQNPKTIFEGLRDGLPATAQLSYAQGSVLAEGVAVPVARTALQSDAQPGLRAEYFNNTKFQGAPVATRVDPRVDFDLDRIEPVAGLGPVYSIRWSGTLQPPAAGNYRLQVSIDRCFDCKGHDGYRLWVDGNKLLDDDGSVEKRPDSVTLHWTTTDPHAIRLELEHTGEDEGIHLKWEAPAAAQIQEAVAAAAQADVIVATLGLSPNLEGEALGIKVPGFFGGDRETLELPAPQKKLLTALASLHKPVIVALSSGSAVALDSSVQALVETWYPGEAGGKALARLLSGATNPSGRLPVTIYRSAKDLPAFTDYSMAHRTYRYFDGPVAYPFGFGLSYTQFMYSAPKLSAQHLQAGHPLQVSATVKNVGEREGDEVAELYLIPPPDAGAPRLSLQGVHRVHLRAGESQQVQFVLDPRQLSSVDAEGKRAIRSGRYRVVVRGSQPSDPKQAGTAFQMTGEQLLAP
ncbi:glycoside hydrolase family 3 C-terminal domain-containing protein [Telmatobacter bradus]|uniref:glycoside hydrolase family 3 C-terminal domain-containing protein n=1 Tax=Telmatobacter bradus TaxID=474953 RepID=UPI003B4297F6